MTKKQDYKPFSVRLSPEERAALEAKAGNKPLGRYMREALLEVLSPRRSTIRPIKDHAALAEILTQLGQTRLPQNINQIAKAIHLGDAVVTPHTAQHIEECVQELKHIRHLIMKALGKKS